MRSRFVAFRRDVHGDMRPVGQLEADNLWDALREAWKAHGKDNCSVLPRRAVDEWESRGAALNQAFQQRAIASER